MGPVKPGRLRPGDTVAIVTPSWGGPSVFPKVYERGLEALERELGVVVREMPHARSKADWLAAHPEARAADLADALTDPSVRAVWCSIGGDDSMRLLPHLDRLVPSAEPKILVGYSDSTTLLTWLRLRGVVAFHGPSILAGVAQWATMPPSFGEQLRAVLVHPSEGLRYLPFDTFSEGYPDWGDPSTVGTRHPARSSEPWSWVTGSKAATGELFGGCLDVLEFLKGTPYFPPPEFFDGKLLFLETSEEHPPPRAVVRALRNYALSGVLARVAGILFGRFRGYSDTERSEVEAGIRRLVVEELGRPELPVVTNLDFGHSDPQWVLPIGVRARIDPAGPGFSLLEPGVV
jgi:muramoyltetrapeptide carboxypeptidase LdcA involved in peptidoglycan recycling